MHDFTTADPERRWHRRRNLIWIAPLVLIVGVGLFIGVGHLFVWLWRVTVVDIFGFKTISFWQAWGIILLSQILFKANMQPTTRTGRWRRPGGPGYGGSPEPELQPPTV
jgi:hypothetical protein